MPNAFAYLVFWSSPLALAALFFRFRLETALILTIVGGYLFLPERIRYDLPLLPEIDKHLLPSTVALLMCVLRQGTNQPGREHWRSAGWLPRSPLALLCLALFVLGPIGTALTNSDPVVYGGTVLPGLTLYDIGSLVNQQLVVILPFLLARRYLGSADSQEMILKVFVVMGLVYSILVIAEWRLSPFVNQMVYGFQPTRWRMMVRGDGWRGAVFLRHGLWMAIFLAMAAIAVASLWRVRAGHRRRPLILAAVLWMVVTLVLSNSLGALIIGIVLIPVAMILSESQRLLAVVAVSWIVLLYPTLRSLDLVPTTEILETVRDMNPVRAQSLETRIVNEDSLLEKANQRPLFGWGGWARNRVFNEEGEDTSVTDGRWIIAFGMFGWIGYLGEFGLLTLPGMLLYWRRRQVGSLGVATGLALMLSANLIDILPNSTLTPLSWLLAGAVLGRVESTVSSLAQAPATPKVRSTARVPRTVFH